MIATGSTRVVVSLQQAHRGLRAPGGYYQQFREKIRQMARDFVREEQPRPRLDPRDYMMSSQGASTSHGDPGTYGFTTPRRDDEQSERSSPPHSKGKRTEGNWDHF